MNDFIPNFTQIPNIVLDKHLGELSNAELRVLLYICRRTYGFHKGKDRISFSQFEEGIVDKDFGCGLRREAINNGIKGLVEKQIIVVHKMPQGNFYSIGELFDYRTDNSSITEPNPVRLPNTQKKEKEIEIKIHSHKEYLIKIPENELLELSQKYKAGRTEIIAKGDQLFHWIESNGKRKYKNFRSLLMGALSRDYGLRRKENDASII